MKRPDKEIRPRGRFSNPPQQGVQRVDARIDWDGRPSLAQDPFAEFVDLAERDCPHPGSFESEAEAADTAEKIEDIQLHIPYSE
jgi:hypothetical protein